MRRSAFFCQTLRESPADAELAGQRLLLRGGYVQPLAAGIYSFLPLGLRVKQKVEQILREEMEALGGQEVELPVVQPAELWRESGRWQQLGAELARWSDRAGRELVLAMTHEEAVADLLRRQVRSYRQLPVLLYQIQTKFRDEPRPRGGLLRTREFTMKDAYSCHATSEDLDQFYPRMYQAYLNAFRRVGLPVVGVQAGAGIMGGGTTHEIAFPSPIGEDDLALCDGCGYTANAEVAAFQKPAPPAETLLPHEEVATPETRTIAALTALLDLPAARTAKAAFFMAGERLVFAVVRGDMDVNVGKLAAAVQAAELRPANADELATAGIVAGYASPIGVTGVTVVVDDLVVRSPNLVAGANRPGYHLRNTNFPRDYAAEVVTDIAAVFAGAPCCRCGQPLRLERAVEVGHLFKLGTRYSKAFGATFLDEQGKTRDVVMASYGIGIGRLIACLAEAHHDDRGLTWPPAVAPFAAYLIGLDLDRPDVQHAAEALYQQLTAAGIAVLYDDRPDSAGVKFNDADLLGMPVRLTIGRRVLQRGAVELKLRVGGEGHDVALATAAAEVDAVLQRLAGTVFAFGADSGH
ncbi:MAG: proline--tRNA ligase [Chloroflexota bacterium]